MLTPDDRRAIVAAIAKWNARLALWCSLPNEHDECESVVEMICAIREEMDAVLALPQLAGDGWLPIESAPKDGGAYVLLMSPAHGKVIGAHVTGDVWHLVGVGCVTSGSERPTHWIPLPPSPPLAGDAEPKEPK